MYTNKQLMADFHIRMAQIETFQTEYQLENGRFPSMVLPIDSSNAFEKLDLELLNISEVFRAYQILARKLKANLMFKRFISSIISQVISERFNMVIEFFNHGQRLSIDNHPFNTKGVIMAVSKLGSNPFDETMEIYHLGGRQGLESKKVIPCEFYELMN